MIGQIPGRKQQIGPVGTLDQRAQDRVQPLTVQFIRIAGVKAKMNVRDLRDQHGSDLPFNGPAQSCAAGRPGPSERRDRRASMARHRRYDSCGT